MANEITPHFIDLTYEAALKSFWRKPALKKFLRECYISENFLATLDPEETKRKFLDRLFENLQKTEKGKRVIHKMAVSLAEQITFPDLRNWEDSEQKIKEAAKAVSDLKTLIKHQNKKIQSEKEKLKARQEAHEHRINIRKSASDKKNLEQRLNNLHNDIGTQQAGYDFEKWFYDLLDYCEIKNRRPYKIKGRQIDGSLTSDGTTYLVELKFTATQTGSGDIDTFYKKVVTKADNTMGIMVSMSGYSSTAIAEASGEKTPLLLMSYEHIYYFLCGTMEMVDIIARIRRHSSQTAEAYLPISKFGG